MDVGGQSALQEVQAYFNVKAQTNKIQNAIGVTNSFITIAIWFVQVLGFFCIGIWTVRIGFDILALVTRNLGVAKFAQTWGTGKEGTYDSVGAYLKGNGLEIVMVVILAVLMMTGLLWRVLSLALGGIGTMLNKIFSLDLDGILSASDAIGYIENLESRKPESLRNEYDEHLGSVQSLVSQMYDLAKDGVTNGDPQYKAISRQYTTAMAKAELISKTNVIKNYASQLKLDSSYFSKHKYDANVCNKSFLDKDTLAIWSKNGGSLSIKCGSR